MKGGRLIPYSLLSQKKAQRNRIKRVMFSGRKMDQSYLINLKKKLLSRIEKIFQIIEVQL